jgi:hypothetical protein
MPRPLRVCPQSLTAVLLTATVALAEPTALDPPAVEQGLEATTIIHLEVRAGASGAPNGFTIEWIPRSLHDALGSWPEDPLDPRIHSAIYLGIPSLNVVEGTTSFLLGPGQTAKVEIGDVFDETGVLATNAGEMAVGTEYAVRVRANGSGGLTGGGDGLVPSSSNSGTHFCRTKPNDGLEDCVHSQGYWKTHPTVWPVSSLRLGNIIYSKTQLLAIWNTPAQGNGLISLAHQLMAAKLNIISGAVPPSSVTTAISMADGLIGTRVVPPVGSGYVSPSSTSAITDDLEEFNTEENDDIDCHVITVAKPSTWGRVKSMYR